MSLFDYKTPDIMKVLNWVVDKYGFVQVEVIDLEI